MSPIDEIKERVKIEELVSEYLELKKAGVNFKALCPFHAEKTPSFFVSPERGTFHCFGCGKSGDIFTFLQEMEGISFKEALFKLADKAGVKIDKVKLANKNKGELDRLKKALEELNLEYRKKLLLNKEALDYLKNRGLTDNTIETFTLGFAPDSWDFALNFLKSKGYKEEELLKAGIVKKGDSGKLYDRFRSRIIFPIANHLGEIVAFTGRIFQKEDDAKYLNSPETPVFIKSNILYAYHIAKQYIRKMNFTILVEGQMDVLAYFSAGFKNTVALSGTAISQQQISMLSRFSKNIVLSLDRDDAGINATAKIAKELLKNDFDVKAVFLPEGKDPADLLKEDKSGKALKELIKNSFDIFDFFIRHYKEKLQNDEKYVKVLRSVALPLLAVLSSPVIKEKKAQKLANALGVSKEAVLKEAQTLEVKSKSAKAPFDKKKILKVNSKSENLKRISLIALWLRDVKGDYKVLEEVLNLTLLDYPNLKILLEPVLLELDEEFKDLDKNKVLSIAQQEALKYKNSNKLNILKKKLKRAEAEADEEKVLEILSQIKKLKETQYGN